MGTQKKTLERRRTPEPAPLVRALDQSEQVQGKVEECAADLSSINAALKQKVTEGAPGDHVVQALDRSERVEAKVEECAGQLATVNAALAQEIDERHSLHRRLTTSDAALSVSQEQERIARHLALHDALTGLPNATLFNDRLEHALAQAKRHAWRLAVMFIDLDDFKRINDMHGHDAGDSILRIVTRRLEPFVRGEDTLSRRGGDEFLFLMLEARDEDNVTRLAAKIIQNMTAPCEVAGVTLTVTPSIGIALYPEDGRSAQTLLRNADIAMYAAKQQKSGSVLFSTVRPAASAA